MQHHPHISEKMKLTLYIFFAFSLVLVPITVGQMWAIEYRGPLISGIDTPRKPGGVELVSSPYKGKGVLKRLAII